MRRLSLGRWVMVLLGVSVMVGALVAAVEPYRQTRQFREVVACEENVGGCFVREQGSIAGRRTYTTTHTDSEGHTSTTRHYEVTWQRADGSRESREVPSGFYAKVRAGQPATLRVWRQEVVAVEAAGAREWFLPTPAGLFVVWLFVAHFGLGLLVRGLLAARRRGPSLFFFYVLGWLVMGSGPILAGADVLALGLSAGLDLGELVAYALLTVVGGLFVRGSFEMW